MLHFRGAPSSTMGYGALRCPVRPTKSKQDPIWALQERGSKSWISSVQAIELASNKRGRRTGTAHLQNTLAAKDLDLDVMMKMFRVRREPSRLTFKMEVLVRGIQNSTGAGSRACASVPGRVHENAIEIYSISGESKETSGVPHTRFMSQGSLRI